jgi:hypothetical protein
MVRIDSHRLRLRLRRNLQRTRASPMCRPGARPLFLKSGRFQRIIDCPIEASLELQ